MTIVKKINIADLAKTYESIPDGEYEIKLKNLEPSVSQAGNAMLTVIYEIAKGPHKGSEVMQWYSLKVGQSKTGKTTCMGLSQMANIYYKIDVPEEEYEELSPDKIEAGRLFKKLVGNKVMEAYIKTGPREDDPNQTSTTIKITGLAIQYSTTNGTTNYAGKDEEDIPL